MSGAALVAAALALPSDVAGEPSGAIGSLSCGSVNRGALASGRALADEGPGFVTPEPWRSRGLRFGTDEMVSLIERAARAVMKRHPGAPLAVADLSAERGGPVARHRSHQSGRDVDLVFYAIDRAGEPMANDGHMPLFGVDGRAVSADSPEPVEQIPERFFDLARNWALVQALATDAEVRVDRIFVSRRIRDWLLAYAAATGVDDAVRTRVRSVLSVPIGVEGHSDHMHVRIGCSPDDAAAGSCSEAPAPRRRRGKWKAPVRCGTTTQVAGRS
ncbi:MAG TPA: penicillin-insensitive murein endopeptidase [Kofleriaceae bacterium]|nr:penicillin-insensitive murein endopeptidase [Kofleriaceae bacterium]